jgi:HSP20 family protein
MAIKDLIPWNRGGEVTNRHAEMNPFLSLHREMNRLFDDAFRGFDLMPAGVGERLGGAGLGWPNIEVSESEKEIKLTAELPGLEEKDVDVRLAGGMLTISGEKKTEVEENNRLFSERHYGRFERRIPIEDIDEEKVSASFKNGVLTVTLPRLATATSNVRRIAINGK